MLKELACIERALNISMSLFFYFNSLYFFMNNKSLVCLFILLLQHICSSSESESESDKRKSKRMLKEKANRYKTQVLCHFHDTVYCSIFKEMTCCNKNKSTCLSKQLFRGSNCTHVLYKQGCFCLHLFKPGSHLQHNNNMTARSHKHTGHLYANVLYHQYEHYM